MAAYKKILIQAEREVIKEKNDKFVINWERLFKA